MYYVPTQRSSADDVAHFRGFGLGDCYFRSCIFRCNALVVAKYSSSSSLASSCRIANRKFAISARRYPASIRPQYPLQIRAMSVAQSFLSASVCLILSLCHARSLATFRPKWPLHTRCNDKQANLTFFSCLFCHCRILV